MRAIPVLVSVYQFEPESTRLNMGPQAEALYNAGMRMEKVVPPWPALLQLRT